MHFDQLIEKARSVAHGRELSPYASAGGVGAAVLSESGAVYTGVCMDLACGIGFCAEHAAVAAMVTAGESRILKVVAVNEKGTIMPPCGRCRELMSQIHPENRQALVCVGPGRVVTLEELLPLDWKTK